MKNLKKVLALVLAFAAFTMFAGAVVYPDVAAGSEYSEAITFLSDLGVIQGKDDGKYHPEDTITRAEACALIARMLTGDPNVTQYAGAANFTDVVKGSWKESVIGYCVVNGITVGVGNNKFEPDRAITDAEFVTMVVRAMGYETTGTTYPYGHISAAQANGLLEGVSVVPTSAALRGEDAQIMYNAIFADYARGAKMVNTTHGTSVEEYDTIAHAVFGLDRAAIGTSSKVKDSDDDYTLNNCKAHTWVIAGNSRTSENAILAYPIEDGETDVYAAEKDEYLPYEFNYDGDASGLVGFQVELYGSGKHGEPTWEKGESKFVYSDEWEIKAIKTVKGQTSYDYNASMADSKDDNGTIVLDAASLDLESVADNAKNLKAVDVAPIDLFVAATRNAVTIKDDESVEKALNVRDGDQYKLMDWDSDGDVDWIVVDTASYYKVESETSKRLTVASLNEKTKDAEEATSKDNVEQTLKLDDKVTKTTDDKTTKDKKTYDYKVEYKVDGEIEKGDIIEVTASVAYVKSEKKPVITYTVKAVEPETKELDKVATKDGLILTFDGDTMRVAEANAEGDVVAPENPSKYEDFDEEELGTSFALYLDRNGFIVYSDYADETAAGYMMILDTDDGGTTVGNRDLALADILTAKNEYKKDVKFASDLKIDKDSKNNGYDKSDREWDESKVVGNVYKYWTDEDGVVTKLETLISVEDDKVSDDYDYIAKNDRLTLANNESYALEDAKAIFAVRPYTAGKGYIKHTGNDLFVDHEDVLAVEQSDIPDINDEGKDTAPVAMDTDWADNNSWVGANDTMIALSADSKGKDVDAVVMGVENFNKFTASATKVGLVTNVSYAKGDIVSIDVATNGKVETIESAEKVDFEDIVSVYDLANDKDEKVGSRTEKITVGLMKNSNLKDYLNKNGAYAEVTTNADGKLTGVRFMDAADNNTVIGHYYVVARFVVADQKEGSWVSVYTDEAVYSAEKKLYTIDTKNQQRAGDFDDDATFYTIDGRATRHDTDYKNNPLEITSGFDGNPDVKTAEASDVQTSVIRNSNDTRDDAYYVADIAAKIDGDVVAMFMFAKELEEDQDGMPTTVKVVDVANPDLKAPEAGTKDVKVAEWSEVYNSGVEAAEGKLVGNATGVTVKTVVGGTGNDVIVTVAAGATGSFSVDLYDANGKKVGSTKSFDVGETQVTEQAAVLDAASQVTEGKDLVASFGTITPDAAEFTAADKAVSVTLDGKYVLTADMKSGATVAQILNAYQKEMRALNIDDKYEYSASATAMTITAKDDHDIELTSDDTTAVAVDSTDAEAAVAAKWEAEVTTALQNGSVTVKISQENGETSTVSANTVEKLTVADTAKLIVDAFDGDANFTVTQDGAKVVAESKVPGAGDITIEIVK